MAKTLGMLFGIVFLGVGILGFVPGVTSDVNGMPMLLGIFHVNTAHNLVHIVSGAIFLFAAMSGAGAARLWFQIFGVIYAIVAVLGADRFRYPETNRLADPRSSFRRCEVG